MLLTLPRRSLSWRLRRLSLKELVVRTYQAVDAHETIDRAAVVAFYALLALVPFLGLVLTITLVTSGGDVAGEILDLSQQFLPDAVDEIVRHEVRTIRAGPRVGILSVSFLLLLWSASSAFGAVMDATNAAYGVRDGRAWWQRRLLAAVLTVVESLLLVGASFLIAGWPWLLSWFGLAGAAAAAATVLQWLVVSVTLLAAFSVAYYFGTHAAREWAWVTPGSAVGVLVLIVVNLGFRAYLHYGADLGATYGALAGVVVLLLWLYVAALALLVGAEINSVIERAGHDSDTALEQEGIRRSPAYDGHRSCQSLWLLQVVQNSTSMRRTTVGAVMHEITNEMAPLPVADPRAELPPVAEGAGYVPLGVRLANLLAVLVPLVGLVAAAISLWGWGFSWVELGLLLGLYILTVLGITVGFHRLFTHRSFETIPIVAFIFAVLGSMAVQGPLLKWVALHRRHHQHSDQPDDPHSPHTQGQGILGVLRGLWHAHIGWFFEPDPPDLDHYVKDLRQSTLIRVVSGLFPVWIIVGLLLPAVLGGLLTRSWAGALWGLVWGGLARIFLVHHVTWSVNSVCHLWGRRPYRSNDQSRNNFVFGVLALGEGWHNTHHAFPTSARHGLRWWQVDVSYWVIRTLALLQLAWNVKLPSKQVQAARRA